MKKAFSINIQPSVIDDLRDRLSKARFVTDIDNDKWQAGTNAEYLRELCEYWQNDYDWKKNEAALNTLSHFKVDIDGTGIHFIHEKGKGQHAVPLLLIHGYPDSFVRFLKIIPLLTQADKNGLSFDLVIPSLPGYGFSDKPTAPGMNLKRIGSLFSKLMTEELGYSNYFVHGGDWGSGIAEQMALNNPENIAGIHLTEIPWTHLFDIPADDLSEAEKKYMEKGQQWSKTESAYALIQSTKPQSLAHALNDSPAGLASWLIEKFHGWSDSKGNIESVFTKDELLVNITIYWATQTIGSAFRLYYEAGLEMQQGNKKKPGKVEIPTAVAIAPNDMVSAPREFAERLFDIQQWTEMPKGGHFTAMEQPELFEKDIRKFVTALAHAPTNKLTHSVTNG